MGFSGLNLHNTSSLRGTPTFYFLWITFCFPLAFYRMFDHINLDVGSVVFFALYPLSVPYCNNPHAEKVADLSKHLSVPPACHI